MHWRSFTVLCVSTCLVGQSLATVLVFEANLSGLNESPPNASPGTGFTRVTMDTTAITMRVEATFSGLVAGVTASHIHARPDGQTANGGVATTLPTFPGFPSGVTSGSYDHTFDMLDSGSYNPSFVTNNGGTTASAWAALLAKMTDGLTYLNIHSSQYPGGEIRGNLALVPEPASAAVLLLGAGALARRRRVR